MRVFLHTGTCSVYAGHTPTRFSIPFGIHRSLNMELYVFLPVFQLWQIKEANQQAILNAL